MTSSTIKPTDSAVNAQVSRILQSNSDDNVSVDASLAPYITTCLRSRRFELHPTFTGENSEHDSKYSFSPECREMIELIMDNCLMDQERAETTMLLILDAVRSGGGMMSCLSSRLSNLKCADLHAEDCATSNSTSSTSSCSETIEELVQPEDTLIPTDLLDDLEEEEEEKELQFSCEDSNENVKVCSERKADEQEPTAQDLVEALFSDSSTRRSRSGSLVSEKQCNASKQVLTAPSYGQANYNQFQFEQTSQLLLSFNSDLSYEAAQSATLLAGGDVNLAQHALEQALSAPPVCRHMLHDGCYRSDCHFSHDVDSHTCVFWMRGRCGKGESCRFLHGFHESLLDGIPRRTECRPTRKSSSPTPPAFGSLQGGLSCSPVMPSFLSSSVDSHTWSPNIPGNSLSWSTGSHAHQTTTISFQSSPQVGTSYAGAASKASKIPVTDFPSLSQASSRSQVKSMKIPNDVWNPHQFQNSAAFHISDPIQRYYEVNKYVTRRDVIDMHFQSMKTAPVVLNRVLPEKLKLFQEVWVVTGTGHHVGHNTHQKGGGVLEQTVISWLGKAGYEYVKGKDRNGYGGAVLVRR
eukprot:CAMPEP_0196804940 /NCGR_PEP_ID=MMETSP1362-20130617/4636_1 /TAXON_ID=163516 /ORGANISM="Leptocylindrus danicus, Strain CCMP1856" /LENGTH=578 /DNA_ID=CAMNT_0042177541 /DNA_START=63 /DNA_END=1799 /DNA_ORIENTATION=+